MELLPPVGWGDVATRRDIEALGDRITSAEERLLGRLTYRLVTLDVAFAGVLVTAMALTG